MLSGLACAACGGAGSEPRSSSTGALRAALPQIEFKADADSDSDKYGTEPDNENEMLGHPAGAVEAAAVATLVRRYYAAAATGDGAAACKLMYLPLAESIAEDYGVQSGSPGLRGETCAAVMSKLFKRSHGSLNADSATLKVAAVRVERNRGAARLGFQGKKPGRYLLVHRERGGWKIDMLLDIGRPIEVE
ncbi:MAG: hypothetical protein WA484_13395 [Solirubrobacteraceae bacterium]